MKICVYKEGDLIEGVLTITSHDSERLIVSGLFEFETATTDCDTVRITNGRFDLTYAN